MCRKIIDYKTANAYDAYDLDNYVVKAIKEGWQPLGGISSFVCDGRSVWAQALVKYEPERYHIPYDEGTELAKKIAGIKSSEIPDKPPF